ncbi:MAG TPA: DUF4384 domain-containing protein [Pyrinomonadaceae bacterium]|jgi:hypothetical protein|nr:DUF4384 domain-containing protein [Pyrinomonadaceae bacterium]
MRSKALWIGLRLVALIALPVFAGAQDPDQEDVRGAFLTTRPKASEKPPKSNTSARPSHHRPSPTPVKPPNPGDGNPAGGKTPDIKPPVNGQRRLGLGMTLFMRDSNGLAVRVDPNHEFAQGDRVRVLLETNADGHLYIFNTTDGGSPVMIYPDPQLDEAGNYIKAHVPFEIPSSLSDEDRLRWFTFDEQAGTERLYFVFSPEPLKEIPIEEDLVKFCGEKKKGCFWRPDAELWAGLQKEMDAPSRSDNSQKFGKAQTGPEQEATTRGIGLAKEDAEPTMVIMKAASGPVLVTALQLTHK